MSPTSPTDAAGGLIGFAIRIGGSAIDSSYQVVSIDTWQAVNKVSRARVVLYDGSPAEASFPISTGASFLPGAAIDISVGYDGQLTTIFSGIVIRHGIEIPRNSASTLVIDAADKAIKMTVARKTVVSEHVTDSDLITTLIGNYGLSSSVSATSTTHETVVQYDASDWDMMVTRAEMNGMVVTVDAGTVSVAAPDASQQAALTIGYGDSILELRAEMDAVSQLPASGVKGYAWDAKTQAVLEGAGSATVSETGNLPSSKLADVCGVASFARLTGGLVEAADLTDWASAELLRSKLAKVCGQVRFQGSALAKAGGTIELAGLGDRFNGTVFVSAVHHDMRQGDWFTTVDFGLRPGWFAEQAAVAFAPAAGHLPPIRGLHTGVVQKIAEDPGGGFRVQVSLPLVRDDSVGVWARPSTFYASKGVGAVFYPEIGDEVIVGFMNEDPRYPVVLGSVYSATLAPAYPPDTENHIKGIVTKAKMELTFDETDKIVTIKTPGGHVITMDDKQGSVGITDSNKNSVKLAKEGVTIDSASTIDITAKGDITIKATGNLSLQATGNATCKGTQIELKADATLSAQGSASAELKSSGMVTVQGSLVKIN